MNVPEAWTQILSLLATLAMGHCVADYPLQTDRIAREKCPGCSSSIDWRWWLTAHAGVHGFMVVLITGIPVLGLCEWLLHIVIDFGKCRRWYALSVDQSLHLLCKLIWAVLAVLILT